MSWEVGNQKLKKKFKNVNEEILSNKGFLDEKKAKVLLYKFLRENPSFASELISGVTLFPFQHMAIKAMMETDYFLGIWCLDQNEYVLSSEGFKKIKDIEVGDSVRSRKAVNGISNKKTNPLSKGLDICLQSGDSFKSKIGHKTLCYSNGEFLFKEVQELSIGDNIPIKISTEVWGDRDITKDSDIKSSPYLFYLLGYVLGDGWVNQDGINYCSESPEVQEKIQNFTKDNDLKTYARQRTGNLYFYEYSLFDRKLVKWLESFGWDKSLKSKNKIICDSLLQCSRENLCALIGGLFDADGYASFLNTNSKVGIKNTSLQLLRQIKMIFNNMGISSNLRKSGEHKGVPYYDLVISNDVSSLKEFQNSIDFVVYHKKENLEKIIARSSTRNYQNNLIPEFSEILKKDGSRGKLTGKLGAWGKSFSQNNFDDLKNLSNETEEIIKNIKNEKVIFSKIKSIEECDTVSVDITVENEECYVGNGFVHHNSRGLSKCSHYDSLTWTDRGLIKIGDVNIGDMVQSENSFNKVLAKTINPVDKTYKITTNSGFESEGLDYHKIRVLNKDLQLEWKNNKEIIEGDYIVIKRGCDIRLEEKDIFEGFEFINDVENFNKPKIFIKNKEDISDWYYFFGLLIGDGHILKTPMGVSITSKDQETKDFLNQFSEKIGLHLSVSDKGNECQDLRIYSKELVYFLRFLGFDESKAYQKTIPEKLTNNSKENIRKLLMGLFDTDGYCSIQQIEKKGVNVKVGFTSTSEILLKQIQNLCLQFGVVFRKSVAFKGGESTFLEGKTYECRKAWSLICCNQKDIRVFRDKIGFNIKRKQELFSYLDKQLVQDESFCDYIPYNSSGSRAIAEEEAFEKLSYLMREDFSFEKVIKTEVGEAVTVDIQVENEHCYVSDGIINHNSFSTAVFAILDAILNQGVHIGIISKSFRQCAHPDTLIPTDRGLIKIKNAEIGDLVYSIKGANKIRNKWTNDLADGFSLTSKSGYQIEGKMGHKVLTFDKNSQSQEWKKAEDITLDDFVGIHYGCDIFPDKDDYLDKDDAYLHGLMVGGELFKKEQKIKQVPDKALNSTKENLKAFLQGLFDSDGSVGKDRVELASSSISIIRQVQLCLLKFGVISKIQKEKARGEMIICGSKTFGKDSYKLRVMGESNISKFNQQIGFRLTRKSDSLKNSVPENVRGNCDVVYGSGLYLSSKYTFKETLANNLGKERLSRILDEYRDRIEGGDIDLYKDLISNNIFWDKVANIEFKESAESVDIEVDDEHCYVGNGFINHNSKMIFRKIEDIALSPKAAFLSQCMTKVSKSNDEWVIQIGRSRITALPLGDGEKLRGFRFQRMIIDELLLMPEKILNEVILPFLAVVENPTERQKIYDLETQLIADGQMVEDDRHDWPHNKIIGLSSACYKFEYLYKLYQQYESLILNPSKQDNAHRVIMHFSYDCAPEKLYDQNLLDQSKATMSQAQFDREFGSVFTDDSSGYFKVSKMALCTVIDGEGQGVEVIGEDKAEYILSFDPSWSESDGSDDFAMNLIKLNPKKQNGTVVHSYAMSGTNLKKHIGYFYYLLTHFNVVMIVGDYNGGVQFLNSCNESELFKTNKLQLECFDADFDNTVEYQAAIKDARNQYNLTTKKIVHLRKPSSFWIRYANELLQASFDHRRIMFAGMAMNDDFAKQRRANIPILTIKYSRAEEEKEAGAKQIDFIEHQKDMIDLIKVQCALIQVTTTAQGTQSFDLPPNLKKQRGADKARKDAYSALVLGNWMMHVYYDMMATPVDEAQETFTPMFL